MVGGASKKQLAVVFPKRFGHLLRWHAKLNDKATGPPRIHAQISSSIIWDKLFSTLLPWQNAAQKNVVVPMLLVESQVLICQLSQLLELLHGSTENDSWLVALAILHVEFALHTLLICANDDVSNLCGAYYSSTITSQNLHGFRMILACPLYLLS